MKYIDRKDIDIQKWDEHITKSEIENIFCYAWYLDAVSENWGALVSNDDYTTILPIPYTTKLGKHHFYQAFFTREYNIFGNEFNWEQALEYLKKHFVHLQFRTAENLHIAQKTTHQHQFLLLNTTYQSNYRSNAKRLIKKGKKTFFFETNNTPQLLIDLFKENVAHKVKAIGKEELIRLEKLMRIATQQKQGELITVQNEQQEVIAGGFFLSDKKRITYLKGAATTHAKKQGAMFALFDFAFERYATQQFKYFDFGGSTIENVASFYKKFGANDRMYYNYTVDNTALLYKTLKRIKGIFK